MHCEINILDLRYKDPLAMIQRVTLVTNFLALIVSIAGLILITLFRGINLYDESVFLTIAKGILNGKQPYVDLWDTKPAGTYYLVAALSRSLGETWWVPRLLVIVSISLVILFLLFTKKSLSINSTLFGAALLGTGLLAKGGYRVDTHILAGFFVACGFALVYGKNYNMLRNLLLFSLFAATATFFNQIGFIYFTAYLLVVFIGTVGRTNIYRVIGYLFLSAIIYCFILLTLSVIFVDSGSLANFWNAVYTQPQRLSKEIRSVPWNYKSFIVQLSLSPVHLAAIGAVVIFSLSQIFHTRKILANLVSNRIAGWVNLLRQPSLLAWAMGLAGLTTAIFRYYNQHWLSSMFFFAFLTCLLLEATEKNLQGRYLQRFLNPLATLALVVLTVVIWVEGPLLFWLEDRIAVDRQQSQELWAALDQCISPEDSVLVISAISPRMYYLVQHFPPWQWLYIDDSNYGLVSWQEDAVKLIEAGEPSAVIVEIQPGQDRIAASGPIANPKEENVTFDELRQALSVHYQSQPLVHSYHQTHQTDTELYVQRQLICNRIPTANPLFP